jgi:hypothetical protein
MTQENIKLPKVGAKIEKYFFYRLYFIFKSFGHNSTLAIIIATADNILSISELGCFGFVITTTSTYYMGVPDPVKLSYSAQINQLWVT